MKLAFCVGSRHTETEVLFRNLVTKRDAEQAGFLLSIITAIAAKQKRTSVCACVKYFFLTAVCYQ